MAEVKVEEVGKKPTKKRKKFIGIDTDPKDVLKYAKSYDLYFEDEDDFLELDESIVSQLDAVVKQRYSMAKAITRGEDVVGNATEGIQGYSLDYKVRPGAPSENTAVFGKKPGMEYYWGTPAKHNKHLANGWVVDTDPDVHTRFDEAGTQKTLGGQNAREATLLSRPAEVGKELKARRKELRDRHLRRSKDTLKETFDRAGIKLTDI